MILVFNFVLITQCTFSHISWYVSMYPLFDIKYMRQKSYLERHCLCLNETSSRKYCGSSKVSLRSLYKVKLVDLETPSRNSVMYRSVSLSLSWFTKYHSKVYVHQITSLFSLPRICTTCHSSRKAVHSTQRGGAFLIVGSLTH